MPSESKADQIVDALVQAIADLESDGGVTVWYAPSKVDRIRTWKEAHFDATLLHLVFLRPGRERHLEDGTGGRMRGDLGLFVLLARQHRLADPDRTEGGPPEPWVLMERCKKDVLRVILDWRAWAPSGVSIINVMNEDGIEAEHHEEALLPAWALLELHFSIAYAYHRDTP